MQLAKGNETKACDLSAAPAGLERAERTFEPVICCVARGMGMQASMCGMLHLQRQPDEIELVWRREPETSV
jgi:hypothetical protein